MNWRAWLDKPLVWVNGGIFLSCWLFGAYHAWQAHPADQALLAALFPPYGIWMTFERELEHRGRIDWESRAQHCREDDETRLNSGLTSRQYDIWCDCTWQMIAESPLQRERSSWTGPRRDSREFRALVRRARGSCYSSARYLGGLPVNPAPASE